MTEHIPTKVIVCCFLLLLLLFSDMAGNPGRPYASAILELVPTTDVKSQRLSIVCLALTLKMPASRCKN